jgi:hypothetical protein
MRLILVISPKKQAAIKMQLVVDGSLMCDMLKIAMHDFFCVSRNSWPSV